MKKLTKEELKNAMERVKESEEKSLKEMIESDSDIIDNVSRILSELDYELGGLYMNLDVDIAVDYSMDEDHEEIGYCSNVLDKYIIWSHGWDIPETEDGFLEDVLEFENQIRDFEGRIIFS